MYIQSDYEREERRKRILEELNHFIISNIAYTKYLETIGNVKSFSSFCDFKRLQVVYASFMMMLWKDEYILKDDPKKIFSKLSDELLDEVVKTLAKKQPDDTWRIDGLEFDNNYDVVNTIKNKLAHGDYIIENDFIELNIDNKKGYIFIEDLVTFTNDLALNWEKLKSKGANTRSLIVIDQDMEASSKRIKNYKDLEKVLDKVSYLEIEDKPLPGYERNKEYKELIEEFYNDLKIACKSQDNNYLNEIIRNYYIVMQKLGIDINIKSTPSRLLLNIDKIKDSFKKNKVFYKEEDPMKQISYLAYTVYEKTNANALKKNISEGITLNQKFLKELSVNPNLSLKDLLKVEPDSQLSLTEKIKIDKSVLSAYLVGFYVAYIYGLDSIYTADERDHIDKIVDKKMFDFSKLDLSSITSDTIVIDKDFSCFEKQYNKNIQKNENCMNSFFKMYDVVSSINTQYEKIPSTKELERKRLKKSLEEKKEVLLSKQEEYFERKNKIEFEKNFLENDFEKYKENRSIVEHIRNSISHGNVKINYVKGYGRREDSTIYFQDKKEDRITFEAKLSTEEFTTLITGKNLKVINEYLETNTYNYQKEEVNNIPEEIIPKQKYL